MKRQTLIALGVAIILGLMAVFLVNTYLSGREAALRDSPEGMVRVAVAAVPLDFGVEVGPDKVKFINYPATSLPPGVFKSMAELSPQGKNRVALRPILINQPLMAADLSGEGQNASISALLPDGMRAATVRINDISGVAGFVKPNDTVDVLITRQPVAGAGDRQVTDVLLQNVRVIAIGQDAKGAEGQAQVAQSATLEVTPLDAQKLVLGQQLGQLSLVLRKPGQEQNIPKVDTVSLQDLRYSYYSSLPPAGAGAPPPGAATAAPTAEEQKARIARLSQPRRPIVVVRKTVPAPSAPPRPSTNTVVITRGTEASSYEVGGGNVR